MVDLQNRTIDYLRVSVTDRCNLRCVYCMPAHGVKPVAHEELLSYEEIIKICRCAAALGIRKIKLTGGEPLVRRGMAGLIRNIKEITGIDEVTMTSNGVLLYSELPALAQAGLNAVNISLDTLNPQHFEAITRRKEEHPTLATIDKALELGMRVKINTVLLHEYNIDDFLELAELAHHRPIDVRFIELMPIGKGKEFTGVSTAEVKQRLAGAYGELIPCQKKLGNGPASYASPAGFVGNLGFISAVSVGFCSSCNRIRLTSTGFLKLCLHYDEGVELRELLRSNITEEALTEVLRSAILNKPERHSFGKKTTNEEKHNMSEIGG